MNHHQTADKCKGNKQEKVFSHYLRIIIAPSTMPRTQWALSKCLWHGCRHE